MKYYHLFGGNGYCGCDWDEYIAVDDDYDTVDLDQLCGEYSYENAESYEYVATGWEEGFESEEERDEYYDYAVGCGGWEEITREEYEENVQ